MAREENTSTDHFDWLVEARSRNQKSTSTLYGVIERHADLLAYDFVLQGVAQDLTAVTFSLWRAVFLSDLTGDLGNQLADVRTFLRSLIAHNTVLYQTDFTSREWAFRYYLQNALFRLRAMTSQPPAVLSSEFVGRLGGSAKDEWSEAQNALDVAIKNFAEAMSSNDRS